LGRQQEGVPLKKITYGVQKQWLWVEGLLAPVIVLKGVAFQEMVQNPLVKVDHNRQGSKEIAVDRPAYIPGRVMGGSFVKTSDPPFQGFYYYKMLKPLIFGTQDMAEVRYFDGKVPVQGYPNYEIRRVLMG